jgi:acetoacetyl-CoA synthetase
MIGDVLWEPRSARWADTNMSRFVAWLAAKRGVTVGSPAELHRWSVDHVEDFWAAWWEHAGIDATPYSSVLSTRQMPGARWFDGAELNYAQHALRRAAAAPADRPAVIGRSQTCGPTQLTWSELVDQVGRAAAGLRRLGVQRGDRVAAYLPNVPETIVAFLATASLGAIWSSCAPEFGVAAVVDRFTQIEPTVLLAIDGYRYGDKSVDRTAEVATIRGSLPSLSACVHVPYLDPGSDGPDGAVAWTDLLAEPADVVFEPVPFDHPLYILYSSGTTGLPKPIVHGHGGIAVEHLKVLSLHCDLGPGDRFAWFTTTGWMMWNLLVSGLLCGSTVVTFDGDPGWPSLETLWSFAAETELTAFGASAPFLHACRRDGVTPRRSFDLDRLRVVGSTGAPLSPEGFRWVYDEVGSDVLLSSISGGTDICSAFVGGSPDVPVWEGEIPCRYLGVAAEAVDDTGSPVVGQVGELVVTAPMPSMPVGFWGDEDGSRYRAAYFAERPGVWSHGDWIQFTERGSCVISGRSDATLNRGGVRIGTAEIYRLVETLPEVLDSLVVHLDDPHDPTDPGRLVLFVVPAPGVASDGGRLADDVVATIRTTIRAELSPRHVPDAVVAVPAIPTTLSGKKLELPVKKLLVDPTATGVVNRSVLRDPTAVDALLDAAHAAGV